VIQGPHVGYCEKYCFLECEAVQSGRHVLSFWRNLLPPALEFPWANRTSFFPDVGKHLRDYTASQPTRQYNNPHLNPCGTRPLYHRASCISNRYSTAAWNMTPYSLVEAYRRFNGMCCRRLQGQKNNHQAWFSWLLGLLFDLEDRRGVCEAQFITVHFICIEIFRDLRSS
jgi:hypothetical protein